MCAWMHNLMYVSIMCIHIRYDIQLPCPKGTLRAFIPGVSKLVRSLWCTADFLYFRGTRKVLLRYPKSEPTNFKKRIKKKVLLMILVL